ncbi:MAG: acyl-CoA dehydrogenase family protein [Nocardioides sp.]|uniref:acyl-CoA dehydrogenase family protein n=1 Tax=Nocardioides sp. TaxID=35761 RepID=UPI0039E285BB
MTTIAAPAKPDLAALRRDVRAFLADELASGGFAPRCDSWLSGFDVGFSHRLAERSWLAMTWPEEYGGHGRSQLERYAVNEELLAAGAPVAAHWIGDRQVGPALLKNGSVEQRQRFLPRMARGDLLFAIGMSEPDSGSDLASVRSTARRVEDGWRVNGTKVWTSHAQRSDFLLALVRTEARTTSRHDGLSQLIIDLRADGVSVNPIAMLDGEQHFNEVVLDDVFVPDRDVLGAVGDGWRQVTHELAHERSGPERFLSTYPLIEATISGAARADDPIAGILLARLITLRQMSRDVGDQLQAGHTPAVEAAVVKDMGTRFEGDSLEMVRSLLGREPDPTATDLCGRLLAEAIQHAPVFTLRGGTSEVLRGIIARSVVGR